MSDIEAGASNYSIGPADGSCKNKCVLDKPEGKQREDDNTSDDCDPEDDFRVGLDEIEQKVIKEDSNGVPHIASNDHEKTLCHFDE